MAGNGLTSMAAPCAAHKGAAHQDAADRIVYLIVDNIAGRPGRAGRKTEVERTDIETVISNLIAGRFNDPVRIVAFDSRGRWSKDMSRELAEEIQTRCDIDTMPVPEHIRDFVRSHWAAPAAVAF
ncbi:hypothetical protein [Bradyrhizobium iriomotense]|uniref:hypothetical protein n=1 Tax=Bradyrhizobium iriomotense TaxID=441950 RepID=UPI001B8A6CF7|nr:hypothetical protein [Bradyrhizobium iriomotense]MBR0785281.1 hypothetical protein [Bradyrhizobium iriomotense]